MSLTSPYDLIELHRHSRSEALALLTTGAANKLKDAAIEIPSASLFNQLPNDDDYQHRAANAIPPAEACAVHLELLETFMVLRRKVLRSSALDRTFGIEQEKPNDAGLAKRREKKWEKFVKLAVVRFGIWFDTLYEHMACGPGSQDKSRPPLLSSLPPIGKSVD